TIVSDCAALNELAAIVLEAGGASVHAMRDPTRGGLGATMHEIAHASNVGMVIEESQLPVRPEVQAACELLGLDPLFVANEGKIAVFVAAEAAGRVLEAMRSHPLGSNAAIIGQAVAQHPKMLVAHTRIGANRVIPAQIGEQLPRIC
ncbi:MAG TPA: AIR synthase-related protein, partial [Edaphobacter sp.]